MVENLVIVESPAKAKTIEKFLGKDYIVKSSFGHIRDLEKKDFGIDIANGFTPKYEISSDKKDVVRELKKLAKEASVVWLASDEDREGEAIAWHLFETLKLKPESTKRIVFHEITKDAILNAVQNPRDIDYNLVNAQQARRVLDRLVGFEVSPVLWKKVKPSLSAGRVQSVAVRLIVEREREIMKFTAESSYRVNAFFHVEDNNGRKTLLKSELAKRFSTKDEARAFIDLCNGATFTVNDITTRPSKRKPAAPFTTSTLQQEASRKLGFSVSQTMSVAQRLYEAGKITYMRTDSVNLSDLAVNTAQQKITELYGEEFHQYRKYTTKAKGAQEAHEAIRPTYIDKESVTGGVQEKKLYDLIWKRTVASQMSDAKLERTTVSIGISTTEGRFVATGEVIKFEGFLKVYMESNDDENTENDDQGLLPPIRVDDVLEYEHIVAAERFTQKPARYTEASLVKKLEEQGIGRPSTYAPTITTVQNRGYVVKEDRDGYQRIFQTITLRDGAVEDKEQSENTGYEKSKMFPTDIGMVVTDFLKVNFEQVIDYNFTAKVEAEFDHIADGEIDWSKMIGDFYKPFHETVEDVLENAERANGERQLGIDPTTGKPVIVKIGRYGPLAQLGLVSDDEEAEKPQFASLQKNQHIETITLDQALDLFKLPRELGLFEEKKVVVAIGRFGPYVRHDSKFVSLDKTDDPYTVELPRAIELIEAKREKDAKALLKTFEEDETMRIIEGRWGPYLKHGTDNYKIAKTVVATDLSYEDCLKLIEEAPAPRRKAAAKKTTTKKAPAKKATAKKTTAKKTTAKKTTTKKAATKKTTTAKKK